MSRRTALVTGCTGGIGSAIVHRFRHADWAVIGLDRRTCPKELGLDEFLEGDVSSSEIWQQAADGHIARAGSPGSPCQQRGSADMQASGRDLIGGVGRRHGQQPQGLLLIGTSAA